MTKYFIKDVWKPTHCKSNGSMNPIMLEDHFNSLG